jgi:hypothetical protein
MTHYDKIPENTIITLMTFLLLPLLQFEYIMTLMAIMTLLSPLLHLNYYNTYDRDIEVLLWAIMTIAKHYVTVHYGFYHNCYNSHNNHNSNNIFLLISTHKSGIQCWGLGLTGGKHSYIHGPAIAAKIL